METAANAIAPTEPPKTNLGASEGLDANSGPQLATLSPFARGIVTAVSKRILWALNRKAPCKLKMEELGVIFECINSVHKFTRLQNALAVVAYEDKEKGFLSATAREIMNGALGITPEKAASDNVVSGASK